LRKIFLSFVFVLSFYQSTIAQEKFSIDVSVGYSRPMLETYGEKATISDAQDIVFIDGKRIIESDNFATNTGLNFEAMAKLSLMKKGHIRGLFNLGYNVLTATYPTKGETFGMRIQSFSVGTGVEINPFGIKKFYPSIYGLMRMNFIGGETFFQAGLDFFKVTSRFGYLAGIETKLNVSRIIDIKAGYSYAYDNAWGKDSDETFTTDNRTIPFRDKKTSTNNLTSDRRVAYYSIYFGLSFKIK